ncbi:hypothetical protein DCS_07429 [Drechmeria coniospora]|uniref:Uncharacterized protein n=1 Tax=Drechmeria coniospora TaxID=98403 RepID=A0A151GEF5_DRECN|nr:hypothetical protein DCS_07429 [Drechmeria coniospora]KYK55466.1 hypothetical protein DCS_07429 [Drechmeria coniospora]
MVEERVACKCASCDDNLGTLVNLWTQLGKNYLTPRTHAGAVDSFRISTPGAIRLGDAGTLVDGCGQVIFRITSISLKVASNLRRGAEPKIDQVLKLRNNPPSTNQHDDTSSDHGAPPPLAKPAEGMARERPAPENFDILEIQAELDAQRQDIHRIGSTGMQVVSNFETTIARVEEQIQKVNDALGNVRKDGDGQREEIRSIKIEVSDVRWNCQNSSLVSRLDQQLQATEAALTELRQAMDMSKLEVKDLRDQLAEAQQELQEAQGETRRLGNEVDEMKQLAHESVAVAKEHASEASSLRREVNRLGAELANHRPPPPPGACSEFSSHELDILSSSISKIGNRASQIESLQMEFDLFRSRIQRLEARSGASSAVPSRAYASLDVDVSPRSYQDSQPCYEGNIGQKRASAGRDNCRDFDAVTPKRVALTSEHGNGHRVSHDRTMSSHRSSPRKMHVAESSRPRRQRTMMGAKSTP